ncbi:2-succinyl-5-enolpyruvyl-6-hydroxy-3-cyclohexene-1-carboxylic-acid synthase [Dyadobacter sp. CY356]|uniref:2-succinyl-5-enolpyruvyl-6-hydroxy-3- cyclohexene-1-carboxylic-acid synthase n=1 Tax=Dyadobacter sp. CY356 TaxID=2906442 RepID=UPI001F21C4BC|nr:2-succinyl-5-enolpyruvyl-6-hydroxy-3-cyclohexene-1-carboxylic-acid synthase [Dyadobacter sp. CY356]MCF0055487.1 2-succinyl-5-enolpyruvyl-6-hydroxy-3-cyclohexene-1-carboxylic-acid synthase [Dyadobacter sp. CY356]
MAILQPLIDLAEVCYAQGIRHVVISPGSRSAALTLAFSRHSGFEKHVVMDERSAGFIALGMAQQLSQTVVLICTSGSAAYNYAPAVTEAFFQQISLLILTADRPQEWIHQLDGQTIYQSEIYGKHVKKSFTLPSDYGHKDARWLINRTANEAAILTQSKPFGPVHINIPIREPFYPGAEEELSPSSDIRVIKKINAESTLSVETWHELLNDWDDAERILIAGGQHHNSEELNLALSKITEELDVPVVGDSISNQKGDQSFITFQDLFLADADTEKLRPDLLITYGLSFISKAFKQFLQKNPSVRHWHISEDSHVVDTFFSLTQIIPVAPEYFFGNLFEQIDYQLFVQGSDPENDSSYKRTWNGYNLKAQSLSTEYLQNLSVLNDLTSVNLIINSIPAGAQLHIANSMPIRYVNALGNGVSHLEIYANRGTSGIDGCVSTAIGAALVNEKSTFLLVGDVSFLYDRNGLLIQPLPDNLKIIVLNNSGGNIFRMIDGPASLPELDNYFETRHPFTAKRTSEDSKIEYFQAMDFDGLKTELLKFLKTDNIALLEVFTDPAENAKSWKGLKNYIRSNW